MIEVESITNQIINADCMDILKELPDKCIDLIITSPPYWKGFEYEAYFNSYKQYLDWCKLWLKDKKNKIYEYDGFGHSGASSIVCSLLQKLIKEQTNEK